MNIVIFINSCSEAQQHNPLARTTDIRHSVRHTAGQFLGQQGTNKAHSSRFGVVVKQEIPRFTPYFQRSIVGFYLVRWKGLEPPAY